MNNEHGHEKRSFFFFKFTCGFFLIIPREGGREGMISSFFMAFWGAKSEAGVDCPSGKGGMRIS